ncbi:MAG TPA: apolipoprotein N-acyltransferase [Methylococcaceae bacterium]|nr:apolipoprotein N-acyltransferase [Methylococcaceae bacterium]
MALKNKNRVADGAALLGGLLYPLAFAPFDAPWLLFPGLLFLFGGWLNAAPGRAAWRGYLFGLGQFGLGVSWIYVSIHDFGGASPVEAGGLTVLFVVCMALYPALIGYLAARCFPRASLPLLALIVYPALWTLGEWFRGWFLTGFPWLQAGYSQMDFPLARLAPWTGVFGVGWAAAAVAGVVMTACCRRGARRYLPVLAALTIGVALRFLPVAVGVDAAAPPFRAALLQGNIAQDLKWRADYRRLTLELYVSMTRENWDARLIVWPETAVPAFYGQLEELFAVLDEEARAHGADILVGAPVEEANGARYYNGLVKVGQPPAIYRKRHLVPFGEFLPLRPLLGWILDVMEIPLGDFDAGAREQPLLVAAGQPLAASVCYEDAFGNESRAGLPEAAYLVNVSNDAWFGDSIAPHQHLQMARMRALETGRWMLRATNTGVTAVIDAQGRIVSRLPQFQQGVLAADVTPMRGATPYVRWGDAPVILLLFGLLGGTALAGSARSRVG